MKLNQATIVASLSISAAATTAGAGASSHGDLKDNLLPTLLTHKSADYLHRMLSIADVSSQCYKDTLAMEQSLDYWSGIATLVQSCPQAQIVSGAGDVLNIDYSVCDPAFTDSLTELCTAANGQVVSGFGDISFTCTLNGQTISGTQNGIPACIAASCDETNWEEEKDQLFDEVAKEMETLFEGMGMQCTFNSAGKVTGMLALAITSVAAALFF